MVAGLIPTGGLAPTCVSVPSHCFYCANLLYPLHFSVPCCLSSTSPCGSFQSPTLLGPTLHIHLPLLHLPRSVSSFRFSTFSILSKFHLYTHALASSMGSPPLFQLPQPLLPHLHKLTSIIALPTSSLSNFSPSSRLQHKSSATSSLPVSSFHPT